MIRLTGIDLLLTYRCTGQCAHCCYRAGPGCRETMTLAEVAGYLQAAADQPLQRVLISGGEPFLFPQLLHETVELASRAAPVTVSTNGYWATEPEVARERLAELQVAGLDCIMFSVDAFHQAHVPLEQVAIGLKAARELGYGTIQIDHRFMDQPDVPNFYNWRTREAKARLAEMCDLGGVRISQGPSRLVGRAAEQLSPFLPLQRTPSAACPYLTLQRTPSAACPDLPFQGTLPTVEIHPGGWVNLCPGLALGNALQRPLDEILAGFEAAAHPIIGVLIDEGPAGLLRLAQRHGHELAGGYVDACHLCYQARRLLRSHYPRRLAPAHIYLEGGARQLLQLQPGIIYGPVDSRRLGRSLGVNLLPNDRKVCSFDCIYCHYGRTDVRTLEPDGPGFPSVDEALAAIGEGLHAHPDIDYLTFSGNGEPTLHPDFPEIAAGARRLLDEMRPDVQLAILSNATTVHDPRVRGALALFDVPIMKLDAGDPEILASINRPISSVRLSDIIAGLKGLPNLIIQAVMVDGRVTNARGAAFEAWLSALGELQPVQVQIYSTDRPVPEAGVERVDPDALRGIAREIEGRTGLHVRGYWA